MSQPRAGRATRSAPSRESARTGISRAFWWLTTVTGWLLIASGLVRCSTATHFALPQTLAATCAFMVACEFFPVMQARGHNVRGLLLSPCVALAVVYAWGPWPAIVSLAAGSVIANIRARKPWWRVAFNPAKYAICIVAASGVASVAGHRATLARPLVDFHPSDLRWELGTWVVWVIVDFTLAAGVLTGPTRFLANIAADSRQEITSALSMLAISPLILVIAAQSWAVVVLLLSPLWLYYQTGQLAVAREHEAGHDVLTGLPNRLTLNFELADAFATWERDHIPFALLLIDLNDFKLINDTLGHQVGDAVLVRVAERLRKGLRPGDRVARLGGDEFALLVFDVDESGALAAASRVSNALAGNVVIDSVSLEVNFSVGVALCPAHGVDGTTLFRCADVAMYLAKDLRTGVAVYSADRDENSTDQLQLLGELRNALTVGDIQLHFQPKVAALDSRPIGFEALVRWNHPERGYIPPDRFIAVAERSGVMPTLTARVVELAIEQSVAWQAIGVASPIAVNVSPTDLTGEDLVSLVESLLHRYHFDPTLLIFEITERVSTTQLPDAVRNLERLQSIGVRISLDDFGTGYSSLIRLSQLRVDEIKIDRVFVSVLSSDDDISGGVSTVRALIELAHARGLPVVAEGVENAEQWRMLAELGCDGVQGWHVAHPMPAHEATAWLEARQLSNVPSALPLPLPLPLPHYPAEDRHLGGARRTDRPNSDERAG